MLPCHLVAIAGEIRVILSVSGFRPSISASAYTKDSEPREMMKSNLVSTENLDDLCCIILPGARYSTGHNLR
jgi:hypothetical protein